MNFLDEQRGRLVDRLVRYRDPDFQHSRPPGAVALKHISIVYIELALSRIDSGVYQICCECGEEIDKRRHEVVPGAIRCGQCQTDLDKELDRTAGR